MDAVIDSVERHKTKLVIVAKDASDKSTRNIKYVCTNNGIVVIQLSTIEELSHFIGKRNKAIIGITDETFSKRYT